MKQLFLILIILITSELSYSKGQEPIIDSLKLLIKTSGDDTIKVNALNELSRLSRIYFIDNPFLYAQDAKILAEKINYFFGLAQSLENLGGSYFVDKNHIKREDYYNQALLLYKEIGNEKGVDRMVKELAFLYESFDTNKAIDFYLRSLNRAREIGDNEGISYALFKIGTLYYRDLTLYNKSILYFSQALRLSQEITDHKTFLNASINIGDIYFTLENYDSALYYYRKCFLTAEETSNEDFISYLNTRFGEVYKNKSDFPKAIDFHNKALEYHRENDQQWSLQNSLIYLAYVYIKQKEYQKALNYLIEAESISKRAFLIEDGVPIEPLHKFRVKPEEEMFNELGEEEIYSGFVIVYKSLSDFKNALKYQTYLSNIKTKYINLSEYNQIENIQYLLERKNTSDSIRYSNRIDYLEAEVENENRIKTIYFIIIIFSVIFLMIITYFIFKTRMKKNIIQKEKIKSDNLLLNILPSEVAEELKVKGKSDAKDFDDISVLFTDFKEFTKISEKLKAHQLVEEINKCFEAFDQIVTYHRIEKIKTIGDAYMAAGGLHSQAIPAAKKVVLAGLDMLSFMRSRKAELQKKNKPYFDMRVGIHTGPVVAGIVGVKKFQYDIWGDTVNIANRMERSGEIGRLNISETTYNLIKEDPEFSFEYRGKVLAKNKGELDMYFVDVVIHHTMPL